MWWRGAYSITPGRIEGYGKRGKALTTDYVLVLGNRKLAVAEAKARWADLSWKRSPDGKPSRSKRKPRGGGSEALGGVSLEGYWRGPGRDFCWRLTPSFVRASMAMGEATPVIIAL